MPTAVFPEIYKEMLYKEEDKEAFAKMTHFYNDKLFYENYLTSTFFEYVRHLRRLVRNQQFPEVSPREILPLLIATALLLGSHNFWLQDVEWFVEDESWLQEPEPWLDKGQWQIVEDKWSFWFGDQWYFTGTRSEFEAYVYGMVISLLYLPDKLFVRIVK